MKSIYLILLIILSFTNLSYSQAVSKTKPVWEKYRDDRSLKAKDTVYQKGFRCITICNTDFQAVHLMQVNDSVYYGDFVSIAKIIKDNTDEFNRYAKYITKNTVIPTPAVKLLLDSLEILNIEQLPDSKDVKGYVTGLDGLVYDFFIRTKDHHTQASYWCPEDDYYQNPAIKEVQQVRSVLQLLERHLKLADEFKLFKDELPNGRYGYAGVVFLKR